MRKIFLLVSLLFVFGCSKTYYYGRIVSIKSQIASNSSFRNIVDYEIETDKGIRLYIDNLQMINYPAVSNHVFSYNDIVLDKSARYARFKFEEKK